METTIEYKGGTLSGIVREWILKQRVEYPYFLEISAKLPIHKFSSWAGENLVKRMCTLRVNAVVPTRRMCVANFCIMPLSRFVDSSNYLCGFVSAEDRAMAARHFSEFVASEEPFTTRFKI